MTLTKGKAVLIVVSLCLWGATIWLQYDMYGNENDGRQRITEMRKAVDEHEEKNRHLRVKIDQKKAQIKNLKNDPAYTEALARKSLLMIKEDEVYVLPEK